MPSIGTPKYKLGDKVVCVDKNNIMHRRGGGIQSFNKDVCGFGWSLGREFIIGRITEAGRFIYWEAGISSNGVYEDFLRNK